MLYHTMKEVYSFTSDRILKAQYLVNYLWMGFKKEIRCTDLTLLYDEKKGTATFADSLTDNQKFPTKRQICREWRAKKYLDDTLLKIGKDFLEPENPITAINTSGNSISIQLSGELPMHHLIFKEKIWQKIKRSYTPKGTSVSLEIGANALIVNIFRENKSEKKYSDVELSLAIEPLLQKLVDTIDHIACEYKTAIIPNPNAR